MMTIKGGVTILPNSDNKEFMSKLEQAGVKIKMPFTATGFKSSKTPKCVDMTDIKLKTTKASTTKVKDDVDVVSDSVKTVKKTIKSVLKKKRTGKKS